MIKGLITFMFDDANISDYTIMKPVFDAQREVAVSAIVTDWIGKEDRMNLNQILRLQNNGWEIVSHTKSHPHLPTLTEMEIREELKDSKIILENYGLTINNLVYPYHLQNEIIRGIAKEYYRSARGMQHSEINPIILNLYLLSSVEANLHANFATYKNLMDIAKNENRWLIFFFHSTNSGDVDSMNKFIDYAQSEGISIVTMNQALDLI